MATTSRFTPGANQDNTERVVTRDYQSPAYATAITINTTAERTLVNVGALTGALTLNAGVGNATNSPYVGDTLKVLFAASGANRTVTFGTGIAVSATTQVVVSAKFGSIDFIFNGTSWQETARALTA